MPSETFLSCRFTALLIVTALTGLVTYLIPSMAFWQQWTYLAHTLLGVAFTVIFLIYIRLHFYRIVGLRRPLQSIIGITTILPTLAFIGTGFHIVILGQREAQRGIYDLHILSSTLSLALLGVHLAVARKKLSEVHPLSLSWQSSGIFTAAYGLGITICIALASLGYSYLPSPYHDTAAVTPYLLTYGDHPFRPSQTETASGSFVDPQRLGNSGQCGTCHESIAREWRASIHAQAASDKAYQTNVNLLAKRKGMPTTRYCEGCHAPVALLSGQLTEGGRLDTVGHMQEGVSCMTCHGIDRIMHTKGVASYRFRPQAPYLFEGYLDGLPARIHNFVLRIQPRQHRADMARPSLATPELCATCHVQFMDKDVNGWDWVQMQDEYTPWLGSPYSRQSRQTFSETALQRCQDCHFPLVEGDDPSADSSGRFRSHRALAANTAIPWFTGNWEQLMLTTKFLQADKVRVSLEIPDRSNAIRSSKHVMAQAGRDDEPPDYFYLGETLKFHVIVTNVQVGHNFPGGTTDLNEVWLSVKLVDGQNRVVYESGTVRDDGTVDSVAYFYGSTPMDRYGNPVWRHDLFNMVGDSFRRVISAGKSDVVPYQVKIPGWAKSPLTVSAVLRYRKFNARYAYWALEDQTLNLPIVDMAGESLAIPLRMKHEVETDGH